MIQQEVYITGIKLDLITNYWALSFEKKLSFKSRFRMIYYWLFKINKPYIFFKKIDLCYDEDENGKISHFHLMTKNGNRISFRDLDKIGRSEMNINS